MCVASCAEPKRDETCETDGKCIEGCYCNKGYLWDGLKCVKRENCGCVNGDTSYTISETFFTKNCDQKCTCTGIGERECEDVICSGDKVCEKTDSDEFTCKDIDITGSSMHLGKKPKEPETTTTTKTTTTTVAKTTTKVTGRIQHADPGLIFEEPVNMGPNVKFPDCLPKYKWRTGLVKPDWIPPNNCCGLRPYNDNV